MNLEKLKQRKAEEYCVGNTEGEPYSEYEGHFYIAGFTAAEELYRPLLEAVEKLATEAVNLCESGCVEGEMREDWLGDLAREALAKLRKAGE